MKKPHVLNRSMFKTGGTSAYGKGITSNLVSDEQRQRFNYGGRVRAAHGLPHYRPYTDIYSEIRYAPPGMGGAGTGPDFPPTSGGLSRYYPERKGEQYVTSYIPQSEEEWKEYQIIKDKGIPGYKTVEEITEEVERFVPGKKSPSQLFTENKADHRARKAWESSDVFKKQMRKDLLTERQEVMEAIDPSVVEERKSVGLYTPGVTADQPLHQEFETPDPFLKKEEEEVAVVGEEEPSLAGIPGEEDPSAAPTITKDDTDLLDTPDKWAFLDAYEAKKKKLGRGQALWEGAAGAARWSTAGTAKERSKAIADTLSKVGGIGAKYKGEAMDVRAKAEILGAVEDIKTEGKKDLFAAREEGYYQPLLDIRKEELDLKKEAAKIAATDAPPEQQYQAMLVKGLFNNPKAKADLVGSILKKKIYYAKDKKEEDQYLNPDNNGLLYVDSEGTIWRNVNGKKQDVKIYEDTEFFGK